MTDLLIYSILFVASVVALLINEAWSDMTRKLRERHASQAPTPPAPAVPVGDREWEDFITAHELDRGQVP